MLVLKNGDLQKVNALISMTSQAQSLAGSYQKNQKKVFLAGIIYLIIIIPQTHCKH